MKRFVSLRYALLSLGGALALAGCMTSLMSQEPVRRSVSLQEPPDAAYQRASQAMARMGATIHQANPQTRLLSGIVHGVVVLNVSVTGSKESSTVEVTGSLLPGKLAVGSFTEVDQYVALLQ